MRSRAQTIAIILSKYKKKFGAVTKKKPLKETKAMAQLRMGMAREIAQDAQDAEIRERRRARDAGEVVPGDAPSQAGKDLKRIQKSVPHAKLVNTISGACVIYPDGSIMKLDYHTQFQDPTLSSLSKTFMKHNAIQARLWDTNGGDDLAISIHTPTITEAQVRVITSASKDATDTIWDQVPTEGFNKRTLGISGASKKTVDVAKALSQIVDTQQSMVFAANTKLRTIINKLRMAA